MKIAVSVEEGTLDSKVDSRFGRAKHFLLYDTEKKTFEVLDNAQNLNAAQGAGIQSAQNVAAAGADALITGHTGPKAFSVLQKAEIAVYYSDPVPVQAALDALAEGKLSKAENADVESHW